MKSLAVLDKFNVRTAPSHYMPILLHMDPRSVFFFCDQSYVERFPDEYAQLREKGIEIEIDNYEGARAHDYLLFDDSTCQSCQIDAARNNAPSPGSPFWFREKYTKKEARAVVYSHSIDDGPSDCNLPPGSFALHPYEWSFLKDSGRDAIFMSDEQGRVMASRSTNSVERVIVGLTHLAGFKKPETPAEKQALKDELARKTGAAFDPDLPLIVFSYGPMNADDAEAGIEKLSQSANVLVKYFPDHAYIGHFDRTPQIAGPRIFYTADHSLNALMRLAADVNLASFISSCFVSCVACGLRTIPVFTQKMTSGSPCGIFSYSLYFQFMSKAYARLATNIGPVDMLFAEKILHRLHDAEYWREYEEKLPALNKHIFGNYATGDEAAMIGARHMMNLLRCGSFVTPEIRRGGRASKGTADIFDKPIPPIAL